MLKISWGTKIATLYIGFVLLIITMVTVSMRQKIDLVSDDYYDRELKFQDKINELNNANALPEKISHIITNTAIELQFQSIFKGKNMLGDILFFCPSDASKDFKTTIDLNENAQQKISLATFKKGMYKMQISWKVDNTPYFYEETIVIP